MAHLTIPAGEPWVSYTPGGSSTGPFNVTFPIFSTSDLNVMVNGVLLSPSAWTFTSTDARTGGDQAGYITLNSATTSVVVIYRDTTRSRTSDYASGPLDIDTLNTDVDRTVARDQDLKMLADRALRQPMSDAAAIGRLPAKASRASAYLAFDANGDPVAITAAISGTPVSSFMATVLDDANAAAAFTTLGITAFIQTLLDDADAATARATLGATYASDAETRALTVTNRVLSPSNLAGIASFFAHKNGTNQTGVADVTATKVTFTTEAWDVGAAYDTTNSRWTPPAGRVRLAAVLSVTATFAAGNACYLMIYKNGSRLAYSGAQYVSNTTNGSPIIIVDDIANGTDYYEVFVLSDTSAGTSTVLGARDSSWFMGSQL